MEDSRKPELTIRWKVLATVERNPPFIKKNLVFNMGSNQGLYSQFGIPGIFYYVPYLLSPTITYHQVVLNLLRKRGFNINEKKFPYIVPVKDIGFGKLNLQIKVFWPNIVSITVVLSNIRNPIIATDVSRLIDLQRLEQLIPIGDIVRYSIGLAESLDQKRFELSQNFRFKPALHISSISSDGDFTEFIDTNIRKYVGTLIRNYDYASMSSEITKRILEKNLGLNQKSSKELMVVDKQGILYLTPATSKENDYKSRFVRTHDLYEIAFVFSAYLDNYLSYSRLLNEDFADFILYKIRPWIEEPEIVFSSSVSNKHVWDLLVNELGLKNRLRFVTKSQNVSDALSEKGDLFYQLPASRWEDLEFPNLISKKVAESKNIELKFLSNDELKQLVIADHQEARRSYMSKNYKATMIFCGIVAEAIIIDVIQQAQLPNLKIADLYKKHLGELIDLAEANGIISDRTLLELLQPLRKFRNIIHPGVTIRKSMQADSSKARISLETIILLIREMNRKKGGKAP